MTTTDHPLTIHALPTEQEMGAAAAAAAAPILREAILGRGRARLTLAAAPSQSATLRALAADGSIDFSSIDCFHMDDYIGLAPEAPQGFGNWLEHELFHAVTPHSFHRIDVTADPEDAAETYRAAMGEEPFDVTLCGLGVNGHLAFNEPFAADFADEKWARVITLTEESLEQQVGEGHFPDVDSTPHTAISLTIPALLSAAHVQVCTPESRKAKAVAAALNDEISTACPATKLREAANARLFLEPESAALLEQPA